MFPIMKLHICVAFGLRDFWLHNTCRKPLQKHVTNHHLDRTFVSKSNGLSYNKFLADYCRQNCPALGKIAAKLVFDTQSVHSAETKINVDLLHDSGWN